MSNRKKAAAEVGAVVGPWALPEGWAWKCLKEVAHVNPRTELPKAGSVSFVPMQAVQEETFRIDVTQRRSIDEVYRNYTRFETGDVLFAKITPCMENGKIAVVPETPERVLAGSSEFHVVRSADLEPRYLALWLSRYAFRNDAQHHMTGTAGQRRVPADYLRDSIIPMPDRIVQQQVLRAVDALLTDIDDGETALARARADLGVYRRSLLKAAVTGELTADWRAANPPQESGTALLARISDDRRASWQIDTKNPGKPYEEAHTVPIIPFELPAVWCWASIDSLIVGGIQNGLYLPQSLSGAGTPIFRIDDFQAGAARGADELRRVNAPTEAVTSYALRLGDIVVNRVNSPTHLASLFSSGRHTCQRYLKAT